MAIKFKQLRIWILSMGFRVGVDAPQKTSLLWRIRQDGVDETHCKTNEFVNTWFITTRGYSCPLPLASALPSEEGSPNSGGVH